MNQLYILTVSFIAMSLAQVFKPILYYLIKREWNFKLIFDSGGLPSSHRSTVTSLALSVGLIEGFDSTYFSITLIFAIITMYDAANVRYYSGKNIKLTKQLIEDLKISKEYLIKLTHPIYNEKIKEILGHSWLEVLAGAILGLVISGLSYLIIM